MFRAPRACGLDGELIELDPGEQLGGLFHGGSSSASREEFGAKQTPVKWIDRSNAVTVR